MSSYLSFHISHILHQSHKHKNDCFCNYSSCILCSPNSYYFVDWPNSQHFISYRISVSSVPYRFFLHLEIIWNIERLLCCKKDNRAFLAASFHRLHWYFWKKRKIKCGFVGRLSDWLCCYWCVSIYSIWCVWVNGRWSTPFVIAARTRTCFRRLDTNSANHQEWTYC